MNKTIIININSIVFHIEEDAYETLRGYMIEIKKHFSQSKDSGEILVDIENRVAEMFMERIQQGKKEVISAQDVDDVIAQMGRVSDFEEAEDFYESEQYSESKEESTSRMSYEKKLMRNTDDKVIGGVCSGLGYYFGIQTKWVRILFLLFLIFGGSGILLYVVLWAVMPIATSRADKMAMRGEEPNLQNFKKELENYQEEFDKAQGHIANGAKAIGSGISSFFSFIAKAFVFLILIFCGMVLIGMVITLVGFAMAVLGFQSEMAFPGLEVLPVSQALIALFAGVLAISIPFLALFHFLVRVLFKTRPMNNYFSLSLWAGWITSVLLVIFFSLLGAREFNEESTIKIDKPLVSQDVYYFSEKDIRVIEGSESGSNSKVIKIEIEGEALSTYLRRDIDIRFEYLPEGEAPYIQYNYYAKGKTYQAATKRASDIQYLASQEKGKIVFDSHFSLGKSNDYRDQSVTAVVYLPIGSKVVLDESIRYKLRDIGFSDCKNNYNEENVRSTEWIMKKSGLSCVPNFDVSALEKKNQEAQSESNDISSKAEELGRKAEELSKELEKTTEKIEENAKKLENSVTNSSVSSSNT